MELKKIMRFDAVVGAPKPAGPYSLGVVAEGPFLFVAGQGPYDPVQNGFVRGGIFEQTRLTLECIERIIEAAGGRKEDVVSCRVFLQPLNRATFAEMNAAYQEFFGDSKPVRTTVGATLLDIDVEVDCVVRLLPDGLRPEVL